MKIGLIGTAGTGKTTLLNSLNGSPVIQLPEAARTFLSQSDMFENGGYDLNIQSISVANWHHISIMNANKTMDFITDRTILDDMALIKILFNKNVDIKMIQKNINSVNTINNKDFLYDKIIIIKNSTDQAFVEKNIIVDELRKCSAFNDYIKSADIFYKMINEFLVKLTGVAEHVIHKDFAELQSDELKLLYRG